jgi:Protein of unknown function (DUF1194)
MAKRRAMKWFARCFVLMVCLAGLQASRAQTGDQVDLALVLAVDCSFSVDSEEFRLQMEGLGRAFLHPEIHKAITGGEHQRIAVTAIQWSDIDNQMVIVPWTVISGEADANELGATLAAMPRRLAEGGTSIGNALLYSAALFAAAPGATRQVIDISSDGRNNMGPPVNSVRDEIVARGITINALPILNEWPTLDLYFESNVAGGVNHFVMPANDYEAYGEAMFKKLLREITGPGIS